MLVIKVLCYFCYLILMSPFFQVKKIKDEYEKKIQGMQREMKELQAAKKEHAKLLRNQNQYQNQLRTLNNEVSEMKRAKVLFFYLLRFNISRAIILWLMIWYLEFDLSC